MKFEHTKNDLRLLGITSFALGAVGAFLVGCYIFPDHEYTPKGPITQYDDLAEKHKLGHGCVIYDNGKEVYIYWKGNKVILERKERTYESEEGTKEA